VNDLQGHLRSSKTVCWLSVVTKSVLHRFGDIAIFTTYVTASHPVIFFELPYIS